MHFHLAAADHADTVFRIRAQGIVNHSALMLSQQRHGTLFGVEFNIAAAHGAHDAPMGAHQHLRAAAPGG